MSYCYILIVGELLFYHLLGRLNRTKHVGAHRDHSRGHQSDDNGIFYYVLTSSVYYHGMPRRATYHAPKMILALALYNP